MITNSDYISRAALLAEYDRVHAGQAGGTRKLIEDAPAVDVAEVRHGEWQPTDMGSGEPDEAYICSVCGEPWILIDGTPTENNMNYCPNCGARMDGKQGDEEG